MGRRLHYEEGLSPSSCNGRRLALGWTPTHQAGAPASPHHEGDARGGVAAIQPFVRKPVARMAALGYLP